MLICDLAIREEGTGKTSLIGIFERIQTARLPGTHPSLAVYAMVTDAQGDYALRLQLVRLADLMTIGEGRTQVTVADRRAPTEITFTLGGLVFEQAGPYEFRLYANERFVGQKSFSVVHLALPPTEQGAP
jgi:hypothetical protein